MATLQVMRRLVRESAASPELFTSIRNGVEGRFLNLDGLDILVRGHFRYRPEREEVIRTPALMWHDWQTQGYFEGDCDDVSVLFATILKVLGYMVRFVAIRYGDSQDFEHVFVEAYDDGQWRVFDPTVETGTDYHATERMVDTI